MTGHWNANEEAERVRLLMARRIDGLVILTGHLDDRQIAEFARHQPIVVTGWRLDAPQVRALALDQEAGGYLATRHLLSLGHRRIAHIAGPADHTDATERRAGYERALREAGLPLARELVVQSDFMESGGLLAMNRLLDSGQSFTAVFAANDQSAFGARMAMYRRGVRVPDDVSIVGVDDLPGAAYATPPMTTVRQPIYEIGLAAAHALLTLLGHPMPEVDLPALELVARDDAPRSGTRHAGAGTPQARSARHRILDLLLHLRAPRITSVGSSSVCGATFGGHHVERGGSRIIALAIAEIAQMARRCTCMGSCSVALTITWKRTLCTAAAARPQVSHSAAPSASWLTPNSSCSSSSRSLVVSGGGAAAVCSAAARGGTAPPCRIPRTARPNAPPRGSTAIAWPMRPISRPRTLARSHTASSSGAAGNTAFRPISKVTAATRACPGR